MTTTAAKTVTAATALFLLTVFAAATPTVHIEEAETNRLDAEAVFTPGEDIPVELVCLINNSISGAAFSPRESFSQVPEAQQSWRCAKKRWENQGVIGCSIQPPDPETGETLTDAEICDQCHRAPEVADMSPERCRELYCGTSSSETEEPSQPVVAYHRAANLSCGLRIWEEHANGYYRHDTFTSTPLTRGTLRGTQVEQRRQYRGHAINLTCTVENTGNTPLFGRGNSALLQYRVNATIGRHTVSLTGQDITMGDTVNITAPARIPVTTPPGETRVSCSSLVFAGRVLDTTAATETVTVEKPPVRISDVQVRRRGTTNTSTLERYDTLVIEGRIHRNTKQNTSLTAVITRNGDTVETKPVTASNNTFSTTYTPDQNALPGQYTATVTAATQNYTARDTAAFQVEPASGSAGVNLTWESFPPSTMEDQFYIEFRLLRSGQPASAAFVEEVSCGIVNSTSGNLLQPVSPNRTNRQTYAATYRAPDGVDRGFFACDVTTATGNTERLQDAYISASAWPTIIGFAVFVLAAIGVIMGGIVKWRQRSGVSQEEKITDVKRKLTAIRDAKQEAQRKYFNRNLDEETFTEMMQKYKENEMQLEAELAALQNTEREDREDAGT